MSPVDTRLDPRVKRTRQLLQNALVNLMQETPFGQITVQDITARAEVNRATFYAHFENKYALLNYNVREGFQQRLEDKLSSEPQLTLANLHSLTLTVCEYLAEFTGHCGTAAQNPDQIMMVRQVQAYTHELILDWLQKSPNPPQNISPDVIAEVASWTIFGVVLWWTDTGRTISAEALTDQILTLLQTGLQPYI